MTNPRKPFRINVGFIVHEEVGFTRGWTFEVEKADLEDFHISNMTGSVQVGRTQQGLVMQGEFEADTQLQCVRCLNEFSYHLGWDITELYAFDQDSITESDLLLPESAQIDLAPLLREYALLEVPISPLHDEACKGLCIECGQDLNVKDCGHSQHDEDSPFSVLKKLL